MMNKTAAKAVLFAAAGVILAGAALNAMRGVGAADYVRDGLGG
jgi:predicted small secreted protein